jgi:hypothetical protein
VTISSGLFAGDMLNFTNQNGITGSFNAGNGVLTLSGTASIGDYQAALESITYIFRPANNDPTNGGTDATRTIGWAVTDGDVINGISNVAASTLDTVHVAPTVTAGGTATFDGGGAPVTLDSALTVSDVDSGGNLTGAAVSIGSGFIKGDTLDFTNQNGITGAYNATTGILTLTGTASIANYQAALDSIAYSFNPTNGDPTNGGTDTVRTIRWQVTDGSTSNGSSAPATSTVDVHVAPTVIAGANVSVEGLPATSVVLDPTLDAFDGTKLTGATVTIANGFSAGDVLSVNTAGTDITASYNSATGVLTLKGVNTPQDYQAVLDSVRFSSSQTQNSVATIAWQITDQNNNTSAVATSTVNVTGNLVPPPTGQNSFLSPALPVISNDHGSSAFSELVTDTFSQGNNPTFQNLNFDPSSGSVYLIHTDVVDLGPNGNITFDLPIAALDTALGGDLVSVTATLADGKPVPSWLNLNTGAHKVAGLVPDDIIMDSIPPTAGNLLNSPRTVVPQTITIEVVARDSKGNVAITDFTVDLATKTVHKNDHGAWNASPNDATRGPWTLYPQRDAALPLAADHVLWQAEPPLDLDRVTLARAVDQAPVGRSGFSDQLNAHGMHADRSALLASLQQAGWR